MPAEYKPKGYNSLSPYLSVNDASKTIDFITKAFGAKEIIRFNDEKGRVQHAEYRVDDSVVMVADAIPGWPAVGGSVHVYVSDVDEVYNRALKAGGTSIQAPMKKEDPHRRGGVKDPNGVNWWISTKVE